MKIKPILKITALALSSVILLCSCTSKYKKLEYQKGKIPDSYKGKCSESGTLQLFQYDTYNYATDQAEIEKSAMIYLPYGYDQDNTDKQYNIMYLQHGAGGSETTYMGSEKEPRDFKYIVDNLIANDDMEPTIFVMTTIGESSEGEYFTSMTNYTTELRNDIIPSVESEFHTYAKSTDEKDLVASRTHRAFGGFSMGGYMVWDTLVHDLDYFSWFMPMSCYYYDRDISTDADASGSAKTFLDTVNKLGYSSNDFHIFAASGSEDFLHEETKELVDQMCSYSDVFQYTDTPFENGNVTFYLGDGGKHGFKYSLEYLYNALPTFFR